MRDIEAARVVLDYHARSKHRFERYAAGPTTLDWDAQPDPFRRFEDAETLPLPPAAEGLPTAYADLYRPGAVAPAAPSLGSVGLLFELSLGLAAWKQYGSARWALRCNPSSGNLHPTEGYAVLPKMDGIGAGVYHYAAREHALERRCALPGRAAPGLAGALGAGRFLVGLSSVHWREAWKYGERAFRYCQLDVGHAVAAIRYAAAALGWHARLLEDWGDGQVAAALGLDRAADFEGAEGEAPEAVLLVDAGAGAAPCRAEALLGALAAGRWQGRANLLDPHPYHRWPVIDEVAAATAKPPTEAQSWTPPADLPPPAPASTSERAAQLIRQRRSTQVFDPRAVIDADDLFGLLDRLLPRPGLPPWDAWPHPPRIHPLLFVHRVRDLAPGLYALPRRPEAVELLRAAMREEFAWTRVAGCPGHLALFHLLRADARNAARRLACHQDIAADAAFSLAMLAEFEETVRAEPWAYKRLYWEAGLLGQVLYLDAEARGLRGTGIGCFFDDPLHELLGLEGRGLQDLYHFAVGRPLSDPRLITLPPYHHLPAERRPRA